MNEKEEYLNIIKTKVDDKNAIKISFYGDCMSLSEMLLSAMKSNPFIAMSMINAVESFSDDEKAVLN